MTAARVPVLDFDDRDLPSEARFELFHETVAPLFDTHPVGDVSRFQSHTTDFLVDDLIVSRLRHRPQGLRRVHHHRSGGAADAIAIQLHVDGSLRGRSGDQVVRSDIEHIGVLDLSEPLSVLCSDVDVIWVVVPRHRLPHINDLVRSLHVDSPRGRLLASVVGDAWRRLESPHPVDPSLLASTVCEAVAAALDVGDFRPGDDGLSLVAREYIRANLDDLSLDADVLRRTLHCSRSTLYRLFQSDGGVARYIRDQRLDRCLDDLLDTAETIRTVASIATQWGFENPSHFHRLFTERFETSPSMLRDRRPNQPPPSFGEDMTEKISTFHRWATLG